MAALDNRLIRAAGGIVWRDESKRELVVIYRDRYDANECCLPKGKLDPGESWQQAAVREVLEETGCEAAISGFADAVDYRVNSRPKIVIFFEMTALKEGTFEPSKEVRAIEWLGGAVALERLSHDIEREVLAKCLRNEISAT